MLKRLGHIAGTFFAACIIVLGTAFGDNAQQSRAAEAPSLTDYDWQALYIVKFGLSYVEWPTLIYTEGLKNITVCTFGDSPAFVKSLEAFQAKASSKLRINIKNNIDIAEVSGCNLLYIAKNKSDYRDVVSAAANYPVLTVAPISGFASSGGMVEFVISESSSGAGGAPFNGKVKVAFKINSGAANKLNLKIAAELLELAEEVIK